MTFQEMVKSAPLVLVDFSAEWCGPCKMLGPVLVDLKQEMGEALKIVKIDVDANPVVAREWRVSGIPTMILFKDGDQVWRQSGFMTKAQLLQIVQKHQS